MTSMRHAQSCGKVLPILGNLLDAWLCLAEAEIAGLGWLGGVIRGNKVLRKPKYRDPNCGQNDTKTTHWQTDTLKLTSK